MTKMHLKPDWLNRPSVRRVLALFEDDPVCFIGGCVRDAIIGKEPNDFDLATTLPAREVLERVQKNNIRWIVGHPDFPITKIEVDGDIFDICSLPQVKYIDPSEDFKAWIKAYLGSFDFTINALAFFRGGPLLDEFGGVHDVRHGRIRFIGDIANSLKKAPRHIIRYFRFVTTHGDGEFEASIIQQFKANAALLEKEYPEFLRNQMMLLLGIDKPFEALTIMQDQSILRHAFGFDFESIHTILKLARIESSLDKKTPANVRLVALLMDASLGLDGALAHLSEHWKMPKETIQQLNMIANYSLYFNPGATKEEMSQLRRELGDTLWPHVVMIRLLMEDDPEQQLAKYRPYF